MVRSKKVGEEVSDGSGWHELKCKSISTKGSFVSAFANQTNPGKELLRVSDPPYSELRVPDPMGPPDLDV